MANETICTVIGNLTADPELKFTQSGQAVANFTVASTPRTFDKASGEWKDGDPPKTSPKHSPKEPASSSPDD
jgi:single-strand DNA-binding protein